MLLYSVSTTTLQVTLRYIIMSDWGYMNFRPGKPLSAIFQRKSPPTAAHHLTIFLVEFGFLASPKKTKSGTFFRVSFVSFTDARQPRKILQPSGKMAATRENRIVLLVCVRTCVCVCVSACVRACVCRQACY